MKIWIYKQIDNYDGRPISIINNITTLGPVNWGIVFSKKDPTLTTPSVIFLLIYSPVIISAGSNLKPLF